LRALSTQDAKRGLREIGIKADSLHAQLIVEIGRQIEQRLILKDQVAFVH